jgi:CheY-like chemotaxis protein
MHGGRIGLLWSEVGKGSTFYFTLPCPPAKKPEGTVGGDQNNVVLAIDDDAQVIGLYDRYLSSQGYQVVPLTDPRSAIETARKVKPFVITLDILMPHLDGWQVLNELKHNPETKDIPVIICSILAESDKGISMGALDYLVKPVLADDLIRIFTRIKLSLQTPNTLITKE